MYVEPNTNVRLLVDVPLSNDYKNTLYFDNVNAQSSYFVSKTKHLLSSLQYQRVKKGEMKVNISSDLIYDCNYIMFQNASFANKWFYAFITEIEYISNNVSKISYEIDEIQSWFFEAEICDCFVEREHVIDDSIGKNLLDEKLDYGGNIVVEQSEHLYKVTGSSASVLIEYVPNTEAWILGKITELPTTEGGFINNIYTGSSYARFLASELKDINEFINNILQAGYEITSIYMCPSDFFGEEETRSSWLTSNTRPTSYGGYIPKNKKLLTYPYTYLSVTNNGSENQDFAFERLRNNRLSLTQYSTILGQPCVTFVPWEYDGIEPCYSKQISCSDFPSCSWIDSGFKLADAVGQVAKTLVGNLTSLGSGGNASLPSLQANYNTNTNSASCENKYGSGLSGFICYTMGIRKEFAKQIDDYFERYGYKVNTLKKPNINTRPYWNYVKTQNATIKGALPIDSANTFCKALNNGITFWKSPQNVGNYNLNNH